MVEIMKQLEKTNDRYDEFKNAADNRTMEMLIQGSVNKDMESKEPAEDINLSEVYADNDE